MSNWLETGLAPVPVLEGNNVPTYVPATVRHADLRIASDPGQVGLSAHLKEDLAVYGQAVFTVPVEQAQDASRFAKRSAADLDFPVRVRSRVCNSPHGRCRWVEVRDARADHLIPADVTATREERIEENRQQAMNEALAAFA